MNQQKLFFPRVASRLVMGCMTMVTLLLMPSAVSTQEQTAPAGDMFATRPRIDVPVSLSLEEARVIIDAAVAFVKAEKGRAAIAVVDYNGNLISMDSMDGNSRFWARFAVGKAVGAVALQVDTAVSAEQVKTNPARFQSALSMLEGEILLIPGGTPLIINSVVVGGVGSAGHRGDGDVRAVKAAIAAWEKFRQSRR
ncbi:MAG TPA: heme-binding protein [Candidatus Binatia bacterium]|nr:heme-binding protein [Candidatus Binatia bacterium]